MSDQGAEAATDMPPQMEVNPEDAPQASPKHIADEPQQAAAQDQAESPRNEASWRDDQPARSRSVSRSPRGSPRGSFRNDDYSQSPRRRDDSPRQEERKGDEEFKSVYVTGFPRGVRDDDLDRVFGDIGPLKDIIMKGKYAFVEYVNHDDAVQAVKELNKIDFQGRPLVVEQSLPGGTRRKRISGPQPDDECWVCGKTGHWSNECRQRRDRGGDRRGDRRGPPRRRSYSRDSRSPPRYGGRRDYRGGRGPRRSRSRTPDQRRDGGDRRQGDRSDELREGRCFICKERGHIKRDCPDNRGNVGGHHRDGGRYGGRRDFGGRRYSPRGGRDYRDRNDRYERRRSYSRDRGSPDYDRRGAGRNEERNDRRDYSPARGGSPAGGNNFSPRRDQSPPRGDMSPQ